MTQKKFPTFETKRLILKEVTLEDTPSYQKHFNNYKIISHLSKKTEWPFPEDGAYKFIKDFIIPSNKNTHWIWGIFTKSNPNEIIGLIGVHNTNPIDNRGFWLAEEYWGQEIMIEALEPITDYAFNELGFNELKLSNALGNNKSRRIKEKQGAKLIGTRKAEFVNPEYTEAEDWILTKEDWFNRKR